MQVTKDMTMGEIIEKWPAAAEIMQAYGLHCFGCGVNLFESLEQGVMGHGMPENVMHDLLRDLNGIASGKTVDVEKQFEETKRDLYITDLAAEKLKEIIAKSGKEGWAIRVEVLRDGPGLLRYNMDFDKEPQLNDKVLEMHGIRLFVDNSSFALLKDIVIDYAETKDGAGFKFESRKQ